MVSDSKDIKMNQAKQDLEYFSTVPQGPRSPNHANLIIFPTSFFLGLRRKKGSPDSVYIFKFVPLKSTNWGSVSPLPSTTSDRPALCFSLR